MGPRLVDSRGRAIEHLAVSRSILMLLLASAALFAPFASAQHVSGVVVGLDKQPTGATVTVRDEQRNMIGEVVVDENGGFTFDTEVAIGSIVVRQEAVVVLQQVNAGSAAGLSVDLSKAVTWSRTVKVLDPAGQPAVGLDVVLRDPVDDTIACVTSVEGGLLRVRGNQPVASLHLDPIGWDHAVAVDFRKRNARPDKLADLTIDMRPHANKFVLLQGSVTDLQGGGMGKARLIASKAVAGGFAPCRLGRTEVDGSFKMWAPRTATRLTAKSAGTTWRCEGDWSEGGVQVVNLREERDGMVLIQGTVRNADGTAAAHAILYTSKTKALADNARGVARADQWGVFRMFVRRKTPYLIAVLPNGDGRAVQAGPWPQKDLVLKPSK